MNDYDIPEDLNSEFERILEIIYEDGLYHPRDIDVAKEALWAAVKSSLDSGSLSGYNGSQT